jgi:hypothetical protein
MLDKLIELFTDLCEIKKEKIYDSRYWDYRVTFSFEDKGVEFIVIDKPTDNWMVFIDDNANSKYIDNYMVEEKDLNMICGILFD